MPLSIIDSKLISKNMLKWKIQMVQREHFPIAFSRHRREMKFIALTSSLPAQGLVSRKSRKRFVPEKPFVKLWPAYSVTLALSYVVNGWKIKITIILCLKMPSFWRYKGNYVNPNAPEKFRDFRETGPRSRSMTKLSAVSYTHLTLPTKLEV